MADKDQPEIFSFSEHTHHFFLNQVAFSSQLITGGEDWGEKEWKWETSCTLPVVGGHLDLQKAVYFTS